MSFIYRYRSLLLVSAVAGLMAFVPPAAQAQGRGSRGGSGASGPGRPSGSGGEGSRASRPANPGSAVRPGGPGPGRPGGYGPNVHVSAVVIGGYYYQPYWLYGGWYQWGYPYYPYYPYRPYPPYGYGYATYDDTASIRLDVTPRTAQVFVDGYVAGTVDDFDGVFQRLRLHPGSHQLTLYLQGYRTVTQNLYLSDGSDQKITYKLEPLPAGQISEAPPVPVEQSQDQVEVQPQPAPRRPMPPGGPGRGPGPGPGPAPRAPQPPPPPDDGGSRFGSLSIRVQPGDADILIDGERWAAPAGQDRIVIQLSEGRHRVEVRKDGFSQYGEDVLIRRGASFVLNVSLLRGAGEGR